MTNFFGEPWDVPALEGGVRRPTPVGVPCLVCDEKVQDDDRGYLVGRFSLDEDGAWKKDVRPMHRECMVLNTSGHYLGVCSCTGWDTSSRAAALEAWRRLREMGGAE